jgi:UDP-glucose 4-epimerase
VAVTGASGYVAGHLIRRLESDPAVTSILALDTKSPTSRHSVKTRFRIHDVTSPMESLLSDAGVDTVVHLAFLLRPSRDEAAARRVNVDGAGTVAESSARAGVGHLVYLSSATVYGAHPDGPEMLTESAPVRPTRGFQYGEHKAEAEARIAEAGCRSPTLATTVLRACPVLGPGAGSFVATALSRPFLVGIRGCDPPMQFLHHHDLVEAMAGAIARPSPGTYNLAGKGTVTWSEMATISGRRLFRLPGPLLYAATGLGWHLRLQGDSPPAGLDLIRYRWTVSTEKAERELGVSFSYSSRQTWEAFAGRPSEPRR